MQYHTPVVLFLLLCIPACSDPKPPLSDSGQEDTNTVTHTGWGDDSPPQSFIASDLSVAVRSGVDEALIGAAEAWGFYGPLEYWVLGADGAAALVLIEEFCDRRESFGQWSKEECMIHQTRTDGEHNMLSYLQIGQQAVEQGIPMTSMGWNGNRDWEMHLYTSSYPFGFDGMFGSTKEGETKTIFHEYFHAVQQANIQTMNHVEREALSGPVWFVEGGAEYMALLTTSILWASGDLDGNPNNMPSVREDMQWKMSSGQSNLQENCPGLALGDISYADPCSYAAYELGAWGIAYLLYLTDEGALIDEFYPRLNDLGWEGAFLSTFGLSSQEFYVEFAIFLERPISEQMDIIP